MKATITSGDILPPSIIKKQMPHVHEGPEQCKGKHGFEFPSSHLHPPSISKVLCHPLESAMGKRSLADHFASERKEKKRKEKKKEQI